MLSKSYFDRNDGVGKSTIGKNLAEKLSYEFIDIDKLIEIERDVQLILFFKNKGEKITLEELKIL